MRATSLLGGIVLITVGMAGCTPPETVRPTLAPDVPKSVVIARVNENADAMDFLLRAGGVSATGEYLREGHRESFHLTGTLLYRKPMNLYLKLEHIGGSIEAGSNDQEFWFWEKIDTPRYCWGMHELMPDDVEADIPLRPDLLVEILGFGGLPPDTTGPQGPLFWVGPQHCELVFMDRDDNDQLYITKTVDLDRAEPFLVRSVVFFKPDGNPWMQAKLSDYRKVEGGGIVMAPHKIRMNWLPDRGWLQLTFDNTKRFDNAAAERRFRSPRQLGYELGREVRVDRRESVTRRPRPVPATTAAPEEAESP